MSRAQSFVAGKFVHRKEKAGKPCACDECQWFQPLSMGNIYVRINCREKRYVCVNAEDLFVECECCGEGHAINNKVIDVRNGQQIYGTFNAGGFILRCRDRIRSLIEDGGRVAMELRSAVDELNERNEDNRRSSKCASALLDLERKKKEDYKTKVNEYFASNEALKREMKVTQLELKRYVQQKSEESEKAARLEEELKKTAVALEQADAQLWLEKHEAITKTAMLNEAADALAKRTEELEELKQRGDGWEEKEKKLKDCMALNADLMKELTDKDTELERMKSRAGDKTHSEFLALRQTVEELKRTVEKKDNKEEDRQRARIEQLETALEKKDASIHQLTLLLQTAVKAKTEKPPDREQNSGATTDSPLVAENSRKRHLEDSTSAESGRDSAGDLDVGDHRDLVSEAMDSHTDAAPVSSHGAKPSALQRLQERFLRLQEPGRPRIAESVEEQHPVKDEIEVEEVEYEDSEKRTVASPEHEDISCRDPRKAKRVRMD